MRKRKKMDKLFEPMSKKGQTLGFLQNLVIGLVVIGIVIVIALSINDQLRSTTTTASSNATIDQVSEAIATIPTFLKVLVVVGVAAVLIGFVRLFAGQAGA